MKRFIGNIKRYSILALTASLIAFPLLGQAQDNELQNGTSNNNFTIDQNILTNEKDINTTEQSISTSEQTISAQQQAIKQKEQEIIKYIKNLATYSGINVANVYDVNRAYPSSFPISPDITIMAGTWTALITNLTPQASSIPSALISELVFNQVYLTTSRLTAIDQTVANVSPTEQAIVNYLSTPADCSATGSVAVVNQNGSQQCLPSAAIEANVATIPMTPLYNSTILPQAAQALNLSGTLPQPGQTQGYNISNNALNLNALLRPLSFDTDANAQPSPGLQNAINFIRFTTNQATPLTMPSYKVYSNYISTLQQPAPAVSSRTYQSYQATVTAFNHFEARLREYVAFASIAASNLNEVLARRLKAPNAATSQAQADYIMATRRIFVPDSASPSENNPTSSQQTKWYQQMEKAPPLTVQRETLYVLAELNYQLYEMRALQERELITMSAMQMQSLIPFAQSGVTLAPPGGGTGTVMPTYNGK